MRLLSPCRSSVGLLMLLATSAGPATAHPAVDVRVAELSRRIAASPGDARLLLERASAQADIGHWSAARADVQAARAVDPELPGIDLASSAVALGEGRPAAALADAERALELDRRDADAHVARARALRQLGRRDAAAAALGEAIDSIDPPARPQPDLYVQRAALLETRQALGVLDAGLARLGPVVSLALPAIELEMRLGRSEAALARLEALPLADDEKARRRQAIERAEAR